MLKGLFSAKKREPCETQLKSMDQEQSPKKQANHLKLGARGEQKAWEYLKAKGFIFVEKNWRSHPYEIDLICLHLDTIVFIEVKSRKSHDEQDSILAFNPTKQDHIVNAAKKYLTQKNLWHKPCRFDFVCIYHEHQKVEHFENVIEQEDTSPHTGTSRGRSSQSRGKKRNATHNSNTTWQPW